jgi:hypothetical protein
LRISSNPKVGILPPGPISNFELFTRTGDRQEHALKMNLVLNKDYHGVSKEVWQIFHRMYNGGPIVVRGHLDIYSNDLSEQLSLQRSRSSNSNSANTQQSKNNIFAKKDSSPIVPPGRK